MIHLLQIASNKVKNPAVVFGIVETLIILGFVAYFIFRAPTPPPKTADVEKQYRDSIAVLQKQYQAIEYDKARLQHLNDSLTDLKTNIQIIYNEKIKYVERAPIDTVFNFVKSYLHHSTK
jgi:ABC-type thiamine transport system substrate-binding protein